MAVPLPSLRSPAVPPSVTHRLRTGLARMARAATTPLLPSDYLGLIAPLSLSAQLHGRVVRRVQETDGVTTLVIRTGAGWRGHVPGQYVRVGVEVDGVRHWRAYSLTHGPDAARGTIAVTVGRVPGGVVSEHLTRHAAPGDLLQLDQATGDFVLPAHAPPRVLFLTAGSGITPVMGMLRHRIADLGDAVLLHSAPRPEDVVFGRHLRGMARSGRLRLIERHTDTDGMLDLAELDALVPDWRSRQAWCCGPPGLVEAAVDHWDAAGAAANLHVERFQSVLTAIGDGGEITFTRAGLAVSAAGDEPILHAGEAAGVLMPAGCRMGICFGCAAPLRAGAVRDLRTGDVTCAAPGDDVRIQTCVSAPAGACAIDL